MSFEETLVCDGCSRVIDSGGRAQTIAGLRDDGGRAFVPVPTRHQTSMGEWEEHDWDTGRGAMTRRHLCGRCAGAPRFYDGTPVPTRSTEGQEHPPC